MKMALRGLLSIGCTLVVAQAAAPASWAVLDWVFTPYFRSNGSVNVAVVPDMLAHSMAAGSGVVLLGGSGGEWPSLQLGERIALLNAWAAAVADARKNNPPGTVPRLMFHVGSTCIADARTLAAAAEAAGVDAILIVSPGIIFHPGNIDQAVTGLAAIAQAAPRTPMYYYHFPSMYNVDLSIPQLVQTAFNITTGDSAHELARKAAAIKAMDWDAVPLPTLRGIKYIDNSIHDISQSITLGEQVGVDLEFFVGTDYANACLPFGCRGTPCNTPSAPFCKKIGDEFLAGNMSGSAYWQNQYWQFSSLMGGADREVYATMYGTDVGPVRLPQFEISPSDAAAAIAALRAAGYLPK